MPLEAFFKASFVKCEHAAPRIRGLRPGSIEEAIAVETAARWGRHVERMLAADSMGDVLVTQVLP